MADIDKLIQDLKSDNPGKRYQACEELRKTHSISESAVEALRKVTQDSDPVIANAAQRAIKRVKSEIPATDAGNGHVPEVLTAKNEQYSLTYSYRFALIGWATLMSGITFIALSVFSINTLYKYTFQFDIINWLALCAILLYPTVITSVIVTGIFFYFWKKPIRLIGNFVSTPVLISSIIGMICAMVWELVFLLPYLTQYR